MICDKCKKEYFICIHRINRVWLCYKCYPKGFLYCDCCKDIIKYGKEELN